jgi:uncharacterized protein
LPTLTLEHLRRCACQQTLFAPTTLKRAIERLGFVQADPLRAPARAQDLILRHRVRDYRNGDLDRRYPKLPLEEDFFLNYGYLPRHVQSLMHPRVARRPLTAAETQLAPQVLAFIRERGIVHPDEVDREFARGRTQNWFGGMSRVSTQLLDAMHYRGMVRTARRDAGIRLYSAREPAPDVVDPASHVDQLIDVAVSLYAPLPARSLGRIVSMVMGGVPQWRATRAAALQRAKARLTRATVDGGEWFWPAGARIRRSEEAPRVRLFAPFDPVVWDRERFEMLWGWPYRFEAYTPAAKRERGHYALPLAWGEALVGWANIRNQGGRLQCEFGYVAGRAPRGGGFKQALAEEVAALATFMGP